MKRAVQYRIHRRAAAAHASSTLEVPLPIGTPPLWIAGGSLPTAVGRHSRHHLAPASPRRYDAALEDAAMGLSAKLLRRIAVTAAAPPVEETPASYWTRCNVTQHHQFESVEDSLDYFRWRCDLYDPYLEFMPVTGLDDQVVLDFGCGPGHDLVGFRQYSKPSRLVAMDVSPSSLEEARARMALHGFETEFVLLDEREATLPLPDDSVDYIHSSGVLHHLPDPVAVLREFRRILRPGGEARVMVYNYESIFLHLHTAFVIQIEQRQYADEPVREAFRHSTDGPNCPISNAYAPDEFMALARQSGLGIEHLGNAISMYEMSILPRRFDAIQNRALGREHREFLRELRFDDAGRPLHRGRCAGVDGCFRLFHV